MVKKSTFSAYKVYLFIAFATALGQHTIWTIMAVYQVEVAKLNPLQLVLVGTVLELGCFLLQVPTGALADLYSRRLSVIIGYLLMGASYLLQAFVPRFEAILIAQVLLAAGFAFVGGAEEAWIASEVGDERAGSVFLRAAQWGQAGALLAVLPAMVLVNWFQLQTPIIAGAGILLLMSVSLFFIMPEHNFKPIPRSERGSWHTMWQQIRAGGRAIRSSTMLLCVLGVTLFTGLASEGFDRLNTAHLLLDYTLPALWNLKPVTWFAIIGAGGTILALLATVLVRRVVNTEQPRDVIRALLIFSSLQIMSIAAFALVGNFFVAIVALWCAGVLRKVGYPLFSTWLTQHTASEQRATVFSFVSTVDPIGQIAGGPLVGFIGERLSLRAALVAVSLIMSPVLIFLARALGLRKAIAATDKAGTGQQAGDNVEATTTSEA